MTSERPIDNMNDDEILSKQDVLIAVLRKLEEANEIFLESFGENIEELDTLIIDAKDTIALGTMELDKRAAQRTRS